MFLKGSGKMKIIYRKRGDYYLPNLKLAAESKNQNLGKYGLIRLRFLKEHKRGLYTELLLENKLIEHLKFIDNIATKRTKQYINEIAIQENVNEQVKADNQLEWVRIMNNIKNSAEEIVLKELIYD